MDIKCSVFIAASVDGFIARPDGDIEWLHRPEYEGAELNGVTYEHFIATVDALVMGRKTLEKVLSFPDWPYEGTPVIALSHQSVELPADLKGKVEVVVAALTQRFPKMITWTFDCPHALRRNAYREAPHQLVQNFNLTLTAGRRASGATFPRGAWEQ
ncbi:hypothetical protein [Pseudomonas sp. MWU16-30323]|uniref:dihydrofolate reductase family protein n=1 Tax=Pseudomonas sp. MWU16-30323 TaxID=2878094 RepID=UPI001CF9DEE7|nr:hypothetical protein [Pseudomonas sp. MWU16-30323]